MDSEIDELARSRVDAICTNEYVATGARTVLKGGDHTTIRCYLNILESFPSRNLNSLALGFVCEHHTQGHALDEDTLEISTCQNTSAKLLALPVLHLPLCHSGTFRECSFIKSKFCKDRHTVAREGKR